MRYVFNDTITMEHQIDGLGTVQRGSLLNIPFSTDVFCVLTRAKSRTKSPITQKAFIEKGMFGSEPPAMYSSSSITSLL